MSVINNSVRDDISGDSPGRQLLDISEAWRHTLANAVEIIFSGNSTSQTILTELIRDGQQIQGKDRPAPQSEDTIAAAVEMALLGTPIRNTWRINGYNPVVVSTGKTCGTVGPYDNVYMEPDMGRNGWSCIDGKIYYLLGATGDYVGKSSCECHSVGGCQNHPFMCNPYFTLLKGEDKLGGKDWFGVTRELVIRW